MNLRERMNLMRATWASVDADELDDQLEWNVARYGEILRDVGDGFTMTDDQLRSLALADCAPTDEHLLPLALHAEFLERIRADFDGRREHHIGPNSVAG